MPTSAKNVLVAGTLEQVWNGFGQIPGAGLTICVVLKDGQVEITAASLSSSSSPTSSPTQVSKNSSELSLLINVLRNLQRRLFLPPLNFNLGLVGVLLSWVINLS